MRPNIVIFASGNGSNAINIIDHFRETGEANVAVVFTNKKDAGVIPKTIERRVALQYFNREDFEKGRVAELVRLYQPELIVLAGFLWLIPPAFIKAFEGKIINIHPSLLPKYGGKGMFGQHVHEAVLNAGDKESGITIHRVNSEYDRGEILFQARCAVNENDNAATLAARIHALEHEHFPKVIATLLKN